MFYVKANLNDEVEIKVEINSDNVFNNCPRCGRETNVDLSDMGNGEWDLYGTQVFCEECTEKTMKE